MTKKSKNRTITGWILDIYYGVEHGITTVYIWIVTKSGRRRCIVDKDANPYLYYLGDPDISKLPKNVQDEIVDIEMMEMWHKNEKIDVWKATTRLPKFVPMARRAGKTSDDDIFFQFRYTSDKQIIPGKWYKFRVKIENKRLMLKKHKEVKPAEGKVLINPPDLRVMSTDIEVYNPGGNIDPKKNPIIIMSVKRGTMKFTDEGVKVEDEEEHLYIATGHDDSESIKAWVIDFNEYDPDILLTYYGTGFDLPYIEARANILGITLYLARDNSTLRKYMKGIYALNGRQHIDLLDYVNMFVPTKTGLKDLKTVAREILENPIREVEKGKIWIYWDHERQTLLNYAQDDARATFDLGVSAVPFTITMSGLSGLLMNQVSIFSRGNIWEHRLMLFATKYGHIIPSKSKKKKVPYAGAVVLVPKRGIHTDIIAMDFASMYPNIMIEKNISHDTKDKDGDIIIPLSNHKFTSKREGIAVTAVKELLEIRKTISNPYQNYAVKQIALIAYGYYGWTGARWYDPECAESTTACGRHFIASTIGIAQELGLEAVYGHTDSVFFTNKPEVVDEFVNKVKKELKVEIKPDYVFDRVIFSGSKARYAGMTTDGTLKVTGFETKRKDWTDAAKEAQETIFRILLDKETPIDEARDKALDYAQNLVDDVIKGNIEFDKLIITKRLTMEPTQYKTRTAHGRIAFEEKLPPGTRVGYIVSKRPGKLWEKAIYHEKAEMSDVDTHWYVQKQIIPVCARILEVLGISKGEIEIGKRVRSLMRFIKAK